MGVGFDEAAEAVVFVVVVAVLDVVPPEDFDFAEVGRLFPLREGGGVVCFSKNRDWVLIDRRRRRKCAHVKEIYFLE